MARLPPKGAFRQAAFEGSTGEGGPRPHPHNCEPWATGLPGLQGAARTPGQHPRARPSPKCSSLPLGTPVPAVPPLVSLVSAGTCSRPALPRLGSPPPFVFPGLTSHIHSHRYPCPRLLWKDPPETSCPCVRVRGIPIALPLPDLLTGHWSKGWCPLRLGAPLPASRSRSAPRTHTLVYQMFDLGYVTIKIQQLALPA